MSWSFPGFQEHLDQDKSGARPQMRLAASERSFNESYPLSISHSSPDTCVNLIRAGTSDEFSPEVTRESGEKCARMRHQAANNSQDARKNSSLFERGKSKWLWKIKSCSRVKRIHVPNKWTRKGYIDGMKISRICAALSKDQCHVYSAILQISALMEFLTIFLYKKILVIFFKM